MLAALDIMKGMACTKTYERRIRLEFIKFDDYVAKSLPGANDPDKGIKLHEVLDNY
ncbi:MAG: hypothetical protein LBQ79_12700 [Deltaproteobacteria bacterium]|jgi:hypothetical protein|nr:hypothetical protein [Deltaproteobacteria bacterium]